VSGGCTTERARGQKQEARAAWAWGAIDGRRSLAGAAIERMISDAQAPDWECCGERVRAQDLGLQCTIEGCDVKCLGTGAGVEVEVEEFDAGGSDVRRGRTEELCGGGRGERKANWNWWEERGVNPRALEESAKSAFDRDRDRDRDRDLGSSAQLQCSAVQQRTQRPRSFRLGADRVEVETPDRQPPPAGYSFGLHLLESMFLSRPLFRTLGVMASGASSLRGQCCSAELR
jgi:hypothetical protein